MRGPRTPTALLQLPNRLGQLAPQHRQLSGRARARADLGLQR